MASDARLNAAVIEDNVDLKDMLVEDLRAADYLTEGFTSVEAFEESGAAPDIVLLDVNLPGRSGLDFARDLRARDRRVGIIILSVRSGTENRTMGYENGVDIYLQKPCGSVEIRAAVNRVAERVRGHSDPSLASEGAGEGEPCRLFPDRLLLICGEMRVDLLPREARLLAALVDAEERQLPHEAVKALISDEGEMSQAAMEVAIGRLRRKLERAGDCGRTIVAVRGWGYRLVCDMVREG
jgi:DNA-binding response OmpR family regulator